MQNVRRSPVSLRARGFEPASAVFALLGAFVYLIARRVRVAGAGPLVTFLLLGIAAIGAPEFVKADMVKPGAVVIDVGVNRVPDPETKNGSRLVGDVDFAAVQPVAGKITPNPGGVGPMTIAMLMRNTAHAAAKARGLNLDTLKK